MDMWMKILIAVLFGFMIWRMWPITRHWLQHGPKGSSKDWQQVALLLGGVVLFVILLVMMVRK